MKTYLLINDGEVYFPKIRNNPRGFYENELKKLMKMNAFQNSKSLCVEDEVEKYRLKDWNENSLGLEEEVFSFKLWYEAYIDDNINGFSLPISVDTNCEYQKILKEKLNAYVEYLKKPAFVYEKGLCEYVEKECALILEALDELICEKEDKAKDVLLQVLEMFKDEPFLLGELDKSYSFRGIAPFLDLHVEGNEQQYNKMQKKDLTFYRVRTKHKEEKGVVISDIKDMLHLPYNMREKASSMRFSAAGVPGLYLGCNTYTCSRECNWNCKEEELYASVFIPNSQGKKLSILNMTISQALINGIYSKSRDIGDMRKKKIKMSMLKIFPLIIATSFSVKNKEEIKYQYLISQALMRVVNEGGIDGIAYLSMKGEDEFQYPHGVNLAIPATDISEYNQYSEKCKGFIVSKPIMYCGQECNENKSYINEVYAKKDSNGFELFTSKLDVDGEVKFYGETSYGKFDDYIVTQFLKSVYHDDEISD